MAMAPTHPLVKFFLRHLLSLGGDCGESIEHLFQLRKREIRDQYGIKTYNALRGFLAEYNKVFEIRQEDRVDVVFPTTKVSVCKQHCKKSGSCLFNPLYPCANLHTCVYFLLSGKCLHGDRCHFRHSMTDPHNRSVLEQDMLSDLNITELRTLFSLPWVRSGVLVPKVCRYYNGAKGCTRRDCRCLHICRYYYNSPGDIKCRFGRNCKRNHDIQSAQVQEVLKLYGIETARPVKDLLEELRRLPADDDDDDDCWSDYSDDLIDLRYGSEYSFGQPMGYAEVPQSYSTLRNASTDFGERRQGDGAGQRNDRERHPHSSGHRSASVAPSHHRGRTPRQDEETYQKRPATSQGPRARSMNRSMGRPRGRSSARGGVEHDMSQEQRPRTQAFVGDPQVRFSANAVNVDQYLGGREGRRDIGERGEMYGAGGYQQPRPQAYVAGVPQRGLTQPGPGQDFQYQMSQELERERQARRQAEERQLEMERCFRHLQQFFPQMTLSGTAQSLPLHVANPSILSNAGSSMAARY